MKIVIAGAGAGKTTTMANNILQLYKEIGDTKNIYCITFTNNAVDCITNKLQNIFTEIPNNIIVSTIHSFLYREIISPYYYLLYDKHYNQISTVELPVKPEYKAAKIKRLEEKNILHQTVIPERAKWVWVKKSNDKKEIKDKRDIIKSIFQSYCGAICIDEAQDIDSNMQHIIEELHIQGIPLILMGDPKQDLKGHKCLRSLMQKYPEVVEYIDICYRCPQKHLKISNFIVGDDEKQYSNKTGGNITIFFEKFISCGTLLEQETFDLSYISKKQGKYNTHHQNRTNDIKSDIAKEIEQVMQVSHPNIDELTLKKGSYYLSESLLNNFKKTGDKKKAMSTTFKYHPIGDKQSYGRIINLIPECIDSNVKSTIVINSIDSIKGREGKNCLFILTPDLSEYLFGYRTDETTTKNRLYVALTRSLEKLTIYITEEVETKYGESYILDFFDKILHN